MPSIICRFWKNESVNNAVVDYQGSRCVQPRWQACESPLSGSAESARPDAPPQFGRDLGRIGNPASQPAAASARPTTAPVAAAALRAIGGALLHTYGVELGGAMPLIEVDVFSVWRAMCCGVMAR